MSLYGDFRRWWASRTINFGAVLALFGLVLEYAQSRERELLDYFGEYGPAVFTIVGVVVIVLRFATTKPIGKPGRDDP